MDTKMTYEESIVIHNTTELSQDMLELVFKHVQANGSNDPSTTPMVAAAFAVTLTTIGALVPGFNEMFEQMMSVVPKA